MPLPFIELIKKCTSAHECGSLITIQVYGTSPWTGRALPVKIYLIKLDTPGSNDLLVDIILEKQSLDIDSFACAGYICYP